MEEQIDREVRDRKVELSNRQKMLEQMQHRPDLAGELPGQSDKRKEELEKVQKLAFEIAVYSKEKGNPSEYVCLGPVSEAGRDIKKIDPVLDIQTPMYLYDRVTGELSASKPFIMLWRLKNPQLPH